MQILRTCVTSVVSEVKIKNFRFEHDRPTDFVQSQWQRNANSALFLIYRWISALCFTVLFLFCIALQFEGGKFFIFLTNWGIMMCVAANSIAAVVATQWYFNLGKFPKAIQAKSSGYGDVGNPTVLKLFWVLHSIALPLSLVITCTYWTFLHGKMNKPVRFPVLSIFTHAANSVLMLLDFTIVAFPTRILHIVYPMLFSTTYCLFTIIYFLCGGTDEYGNNYVYPIIDWTNPVRGLATYIGVFVLYVILSFILFSAYKLKVFLHKVFCLECTSNPVQLNGF